jgi:hypothetical protein
LGLVPEKKSDFFNNNNNNNNKRIILKGRANLKLTAVRELNHRVFGGCFAAKRKTRSIND